MNQFICMLAASITEDDLDNLDYPVIVQPKIDGIRCCILNGYSLSRTLKPIPNRFIRSKLENMMQSYPFLIDGELIVGDKFQDTSSAVMSQEGEPKFEYIIFDYLQEDNNAPYWLRSDHIKFYCQADKRPSKISEWQKVANNKVLVLEFEKQFLELGWEGIIVRSPSAPYKFGRSTIREQALLKLKRFVDAEAKVVGFIPLEKNDNELTFDERGYAKRSSYQLGKHILPMVGALQVVGINGAFKDVTFNVGSGFTESERKKMWDYQDKFINRILTYKYQPIGVKDKPRSPVFKYWREDL